MNKRILLFLFLFSAAANQSLHSKNIVCKHGEQDVYFSQVSDYPEYKDEFIKYAQEHINDGSLRAMRLNELTVLYPSEISSIVDSIIQHIENSTISVRHLNKIYDAMFVLNNEIPLTVRRVVRFMIADKNMPALKRIYRFIVIGEKMIDTQRQRIIQAAAKKWSDKLVIKNNIMDILTNDKMTIEAPSFLPHSFQSTQGTQTEHHACRYLPEIIEMLTPYKTKVQNPFVQKMLLNALKKEIEEHKKGNYTFWHARNYSWDYCAYVYKQLHNITQPFGNKVSEDYTFLRFDNSKTHWSGCNGEENITIVEKLYNKFCYSDSWYRFLHSMFKDTSIDALYMNLFLFGNVECYGNSTIQLLLNDDDNSFNKVDTFTSEYICSQFELESYYTKYESDFKKLKQLHNDANTSGVGNLLMISVDKKNVDHIYSSGPHANQRAAININNGQSTAEIKKIIQSVETKQITEFDHPIAVLPLTKDYALDPQKGPRIYSFNATDPAKRQEFEDFGTKLFAKIEADLKITRIK